VIFARRMGDLDACYEFGVFSNGYKGVRCRVSV